MYDSGSFDSIDDRWSELWVLMTDTQILKMIEECVHECSYTSSLTRSGMRIDACLFVDDGEVIILEDYLEWYILCYECHLIDSPANLDNITTIYFFVFGKMSSIAGYLPFFYHLLEIAA
jgi:hypothetical protein